MRAVYSPLAPQLQYGLADGACPRACSYAYLYLPKTSCHLWTRARALSTETFFSVTADRPLLPRGPSHVVRRAMCEHTCRGRFCSFHSFVDRYGYPVAAASRPHQRATAGAPVPAGDRPPDARAATNFVLARLCSLVGPGRVRAFLSGYLAPRRFEGL